MTATLNDGDVIEILPDPAVLAERRAVYCVCCHHPTGELVTPGTDPKSWYCDGCRDLPQPWRVERNYNGDGPEYVTTTTDVRINRDEDVQAEYVRRTQDELRNHGDGRPFVPLGGPDRRPGRRATIPTTPPVYDDEDDTDTCDCTDCRLERGEIYWDDEDEVYRYADDDTIYDD